MLMEKKKRTLQEIYSSAISTPGFKVFAENEGYHSDEIAQFLKEKKSNPMKKKEPS